MRLAGGVDSQYIQIAHCPGGQLTNWRIIILQRFTARSESSELQVIFLSLGIQCQEEEVPEYLAVKASRTWLQELHRTGRNRDFTLKGCTQNLVHQDQGQKQWFERSLSQTYHLVLGGLLGRKRWLWLTMRTRTLVEDISGRIHLHELSWRLTLWHQDLATPNRLGCLRPNNKLGGDIAPPKSGQVA